jgi:hypothetical protein
VTAPLNDAELESLQAVGHIPVLVTTQEWVELKVENRHLAALLRQVEWSGTYLSPGDCCLFCHQYDRDGHAPDCSLAAALARVPAEGEA